MSETWKQRLAREKQEHLKSDKRRFAEQDDEACFGMSEEFKKGYAAAKLFYGDMSISRGELLLTEQLFNEKKIKEALQMEQKIKDLIAETELYSKAMQEVEAHWLTRYVRLCQSFGNGLRYKMRDVYVGARYLVKAILPRKKGHERDCRSALYRRLQAHLNGDKNE